MRSPNFRLFLGGQLISKVGIWMQMVTISLLVLDMTDSGFSVGLITAMLYVPVLLLSPWAGLWSDRCDRHRLLLGLNAFAAVLAGVFAALVLTDQIQFWSTYSLALLTGTFTALENPTRRALVADLVQDADVANAVGLNSSLTTVSRVIGPAIAGVLIAGPGIGWCFAANAISFAPQIAMFARMDRSQFVFPSELRGVRANYARAFAMRGGTRRCACQFFSLQQSAHRPTTFRSSCPCSQPETPTAARQPTHCSTRS
jgi:MFS family permease